MKAPFTGYYLYLFRQAAVKNPRIDEATIQEILDELTYEDPEAEE